jgi:histidine triad (HIT) family protein
MNNCIFCKIINSEIGAEKIYENNHTFAFLDIKPTNPGHTLVVPKEHHENIFDASDFIMREIMSTAKLLAPPIKHAVMAQGINLIMNNGPSAGQLVFHAHLHIVPRFPTDGLRHWKGKAYKQGEIEIIAKSIKENIDT